jgi:hypothetical protein
LKSALELTYDACSRLERRQRACRVSYPALSQEPRAERHPFAARFFVTRDEARRIAANIAKLPGQAATIEPTRLPSRSYYLHSMSMRKQAVEPKDKVEIVRCPACGGYFDLCDAGQVFDHLGPLPHPAVAQPQ